MDGFNKNELSQILSGYYLNDLKDDLLINNFEIEVRYLDDFEALGNCFISISNTRWNSYQRKATKWIDGNKRILDHYHKCELIITEKPIEELKHLVMQLIVPDSYKAMGILAKAARGKMKNPVIAITGSVGKSTTRLILEHLLLENNTIVATRGNHNTQVGVPFHGTKLCKNPDFGILEISLNALNNRGNQSLIIQPDVCIVTSIGEAHLSTLHSTENVARLKSRIFAGLKKDGLVILNKDIKEKEFNILYEKAKERTDRIKTYSMTNPEANLFLKNISHEKYLSTVQFEYNGSTFQFEIMMPSNGVIENSLGAFLCLAEMNHDLNALLPKIFDFKSLDNVIELKHFKSFDQRTIDVLDDTHNAAIPSMVNAIETFKIKQAFYKGAKILVLGQVSDLGENSQTLHNDLLPQILSSGADYIFGHGHFMKDVIKNLPKDRIGGWFDNAKDLSQRIPLYCSDDSLILLKGSVSGSDFYMTSRYLPEYINNSNVKLSSFDSASIADILQPAWGAVGYNMTTNSKVFTVGDGDSSAIEGLGPILLLHILNEKGIGNDTVTLKKWPTNKGKSLQKKPFRTDELFSIAELWEELKITQHPSAIFELSTYYFGSRRAGFEEIERLAKSIGLKPSATMNLTGRYRVKEQQSYHMEDLVKVGKMYFQQKELIDSLPVIRRDNGSIEMKSIFWGNLRKSAICFYGDILICMIGLKSVSDHKKIPLTYLKIK